MEDGLIYLNPEMRENYDRFCLENMVNQTVSSFRVAQHQTVLTCLSTNLETPNSGVLSVIRFIVWRVEWNSTLG